MRMLFEVADLEEASPATVSRLGVVYVTPADLGWKPYVQSWLPNGVPENVPEPLRLRIMELFDTSFQDGLDFQRKELLEPVRTVDLQLAASLCSLLQSFLERKGQAALDWAAITEDEAQRAIDGLFAFSYVWTVGGSVGGVAVGEDDEEDEAGASGLTPQERFDKFVKGHPVLSRMRWPGTASVFDVCPDLSKPDLPWIKWSNMVDEFHYDKSLPYFALVVPTVDTVRFSYVFEAQLERLYPVFFTGLTGTGKTVVVQDYLNRASAQDYDGGVQVSPIVLNFSARTPSKGSQLTIEEKMERKKKDLLGPPANKRAVVFVDDVNMPAVEEYGA